MGSSCVMMVMGCLSDPDRDLKILHQRPLLEHGGSRSVVGGR